MSGSKARPGTENFGSGHQEELGFSVGFCSVNAVPHLFVSEPVDARAALRASEAPAGPLTHKISSSITYHYHPDPHTPPPPGPSRAAPGSSCGRGAGCTAGTAPPPGAALAAATPLLVHAVSIGGYTFSTMLSHLAQGPERYARITERVRGHVYDSMVAGSLEHMAAGLGKTLFPRLEFLVRNAALFFFWLFRRHTADFYDSGVHVFRNNPVRAPALFFFCDNDVMCDPVAMETVMELWRGRGVAVDRRRWPVSVHAAHLRCHRDEYLAALEAFLSSLPTTPLAAAASAASSGRPRALTDVV
ncbi:uncharacterized protein LOC115532662 [Gadus morhua]|uniref:uncharacterized protein LOC115532662 n=1 Tax=Gadus morhua TaxID=8049 RepID=UPI0011B450DE|nr:uncharacterized protein LOC115532662 [Gadus morhua]